MQTAVEIVDALSNVQAASLLKRLNQMAFEAVSYNDVVSHLPPDLVELRALENLDPNLRKRLLDADTSVALTRRVLTSFAHDKDLAPMVVEAWEQIKHDDGMFIEVIVALGLLANLTLFMATTKLKFKSGGLTIVKGTADASLVKEVLSPIKDAVGKVATLA